MTGWGIQRIFTFIGPEAAWKYVGGFFGLVPGYLIKYFLDKRFVFRGNTGASNEGGTQN